MSSEIINLNDSSPAAPSAAVNVKWQKGSSSGTDPSTGLPIYPVSANVAAATISALGAVRPDGTTIVIDGTGTISSPSGAGGVTHSEPLTDGNANFIFAATLSEGGDIIVVVGVPN
jgi:hypothetical protein